ncbi:MAG: ribosome small subunit-dependent GTPase A [Candidatus Izemoplasma sp.]|nr:ribosome small subunit-dependent GTPase A [Candidatus Izemoplasma sp.]
MKNGRIIKLIGGKYTVLGEQGDVITLTPRGKMRHINTSPKVGDLVTYNDDFIQEVLPRHNDLVRPAIANVDQALLIHSATRPTFSFNLLDRFLTIIENEDITPIIVVTKIDLLRDHDLINLKEQLAYYEEFYDIYYVDAKHREHIEQLDTIFTDKISVLAGQTGAGKSTLLNAIDPTLNLKTDDISDALGRGKHTTRHVELIPLSGGLIADTPGFSKLDFRNIDLDNVPLNFVDFFALSHQCKFNGCTHINEPKCAVKQALNDGDILPSRYENYKRIYEEVKDIKPKY